MGSVLKVTAGMGLAFLSCEKVIDMQANSKMADFMGMELWRIIMVENMWGDGKRASTMGRAL